MSSCHRCQNLFMNVRLFKGKIRCSPHLPSTFVCFPPFPIHFLYVLMAFLHVPFHSSISSSFPPLSAPFLHFLLLSSTPCFFPSLPTSLALILHFCAFLKSSPVVLLYFPPFPLFSSTSHSFPPLPAPLLHSFSSPFIYFPASSNLFPDAFLLLSATFLLFLIIFLPFPLLFLHFSSPFLQNFTTIRVSPLTQKRILRVLVRPLSRGIHRYDNFQASSRHPFDKLKAPV